VLSGHLLLMFAAWVSTSLCLHRLLLHYPERAGAVFSARKKFVFSRLGDACLLGAAIGLHRVYGTWDFEELFAKVAAGQTAGLTSVGFLLVVCAALKSAQFPFHSWLPDTMETPTSVSAFMHAGIINAGGFLLVRLSPVIIEAPAALNLIAVIGALTAAFGAVVMLAQPSVKRALAYSTIAQMGFMLLQCGLGAFGLALLHLVAHSLYKAHAFLRSGSSVGTVARAAVVLRTPALTLGMLVGSLIVVGLTAAFNAMSTSPAAHFDVFSISLFFALAYGLARAWSVGRDWHFVVRSFTAALLIGAASILLHLVASRLFPLAHAVQPSSLVLALIGAIFAALFLFQALLWRTGQHPLGRSLYVHALNGFYIGTFANRLLLHLWPRSTRI
jgi:NAD(P)H-quinone oxidoreductase subunit 5